MFPALKYEKLSDIHETCDSVVNKFNEMCPDKLSKSYMYNECTRQM
jgi:hypothetical protein